MATAQVSPPYVSTPAYGTPCRRTDFFFLNFLRPLQGVTALNVVFLKRCKHEFLYELFYLDLLERSTSLSVWRWEKVKQTGRGK